MAVYTLGTHTPEIARSAWVADSAQVIGKVVLKDKTSIWFGAIMRGDTETITVGMGSNIQDGCVLHTDTGFPLCVGENVTVGHKVTLHGCSVGDGSLIGIGAIVLNGAKIGKNCLVGAGALVTEGKEFPDGSLIVGAPARVVRALSATQIAGLYQSAQHYQNNAQIFSNQLIKM